MLDFEKADLNRYTRSQARRMDTYLRRKTMQAARKIGCSDPLAAARSRTTYRQAWAEKVASGEEREDSPD